LLDYVIVFALGFLIAGLVGFALLPVVWARALRLTQRRLETGIPISMAEVRAGQDHVRADAAIELRRLEARFESERDRRHAALAEVGRQSTIIRRLTVENEARLRRVRDIEAGSLSTQASLLDQQQEVAALRAELAAATVTLALRDDTLAELRREIDAGRLDVDSQRVEIAALRTRLEASQEEIQRRQRDIADLIAAGVDRDGRIALQAIEISKRDGVAAGLEARVAAQESTLAALEQRLSKRAAEARNLEGGQSELEQRLVRMTESLRRSEVALAERDGKLAFTAGREAELINEIARLRSEAQRTALDLARGSEAERSDRSLIEAQLQSLRSDRSRLELEAASLKREAREGWRAVEADNVALRREIGRVAAEIAREAALRQGHPPKGLGGLVAANDEGRSSSEDAQGPPSAEGADHLVDAPPV
jgi:uncharacterized coiled-coil protein SlyX